jgi:cysteine-S-conjugate beta-lyase
MTKPVFQPSQSAPATFLSHTGRMSREHAGFVNVPVYRGSTILAESLEQWESAKDDKNPMSNYGRFGSPLTKAFESAMCQLEGGFGARVFPSGLSACTHALIGLLKAGDHVLMTDSVYGPTRTFADNVLKRMNIDIEYFHPTRLDDLRAKLRSETKVVYVESPGSMTFEVQDIAAIAALAHANNAYVVMDNTWATPLFFKPIEHGVDISIQSATKYVIGHSDALLGVATSNERAWPFLQATSAHFGETAGPDDIFLALRGLRTLGVRMELHWKNGLMLAQWLSKHPAVVQVLHPGLADDPGHALWRRDFKGASGLFGVVLKPMSKRQLSTLFSRLTLFGIGLSWGGFESLALLVDPPPARTEGSILQPGHLIRVHVGLEHPDDLIADFSQALEAARAVQ